MPPSPTPEPGQIETVRDIAQLYSFELAETLINRLNDVQWTATIQDISEWTPLRGKQTRIKGDGIDIDKDRNRLEIINRVRPRLGLSKLSLADLSAEGGGGSYAVFTPPRSCRE